MDNFEAQVNIIAKKILHTNTHRNVHLCELVFFSIRIFCKSLAFCSQWPEYHPLVANRIKTFGIIFECPYADNPIWPEFSPVIRWISFKKYCWINFCKTPLAIDDRIITFERTEVECKSESKKFIGVIRYKATESELGHLYIVIF